MEDVEAFISNLPQDERILVRRLRTLILDSDPRIREKLSYGVPYFLKHKRLFFLWPASANLSFKRSPLGQAPKVTLGFCYGNLLSNDRELLLREGRKQVYTVSIFSVKDVDELALSESIREALIIDEQYFKEK